ncbi:MAG: hypothetical protein ACE5NW_03560 [Acidiferrobacterales bacterium]
MSKTRLSLFYLATYLSIGGIGFLALPKMMLSLLLSNGDYSNLMLRMLGMLLLGLGITVVQIIRHRATALYETTLIIRVLFLALFTLFYFVYEDPMLLVLLAIVGLGFVLTLTGHMLDRKGDHSA